jgi:hypothetical protein
MTIGRNTCSFKDSIKRVVEGEFGRREDKKEYL